MGAKILEKEMAVKLRKDGKSLIEIAKTLLVSKSSVSLWIRGIPQPEQFTKEYRHQLKLQRLEK